MKILIANPGSTSYKCKLYDMQTEQVLFQAGVEKIGEEQAIVSFKSADEEWQTEMMPVPDYTSAVNLTISRIIKIISISEIAGVGFKTVLAKGISGCVALSDNVIAAMQAFQPIAPVHTAVYLTAIGVFRELLPQTPLIGLFETAFHNTMPEEAFLYGIPYNYYLKHGIRKYGFHGASHRYIMTYIAEQYHKGKLNFRLISCHLGGSSSLCAIKNGISLDTSMGMSPQSGLLNARRTGDLDCFALLYLMEVEHLSIEQIRKILIGQSGVYGISGISGDFRDIEQAMQKGNKRAEAAFNTFAYYVKRYIGEYLAVLNGCDYLVFTGGLGEHSPVMRRKILANMENLGIILDEEKNRRSINNYIISHDGAPIKICVIPTNEELIVARAVQDHLRSAYV
jgi:acetate kinase